MMSSQGNKDMSTKDVSLEQSSASGGNRKRGRPRKYDYPTYELSQRAKIQSVPPLQSTQGGSNIRQDEVQENHTSGDSIGSKMYTFQVLPVQQAKGNQSGQSRNFVNLAKTSHSQVKSGKDDIIGKHFVGKMTNKCPGFRLITVRVKDNQMLKGWIPDQKNLNPIMPKDDLTPELPMFPSSQVQKQASAIPKQAAPAVPIHLEDATLAKPLQMRRPVDKTIAKHVIPLSMRPYMGSGVVAAVPVSVSHSSVETGTLSKQDTECMVSQSPVAAVPITSVRPIFISGKQVDNQNELVGEKSFKDLQKDSESSNGAKDSSVKADKLDAALVDVAVKDTLVECQLFNVQGTDELGESSGTRAQTNSANSDNQSSKDPLEKSDQLRTATDVLKGVDSKLDSPDVIYSVHEEHEMKDDSK